MTYSVEFCSWSTGASHVIRKAKSTGVTPMDQLELLSRTNPTGPHQLPAGSSVTSCHEGKIKIVSQVCLAENHSVQHEELELSVRMYVVTKDNFYADRKPGQTGGTWVRNAVMLWRFHSEVELRGGGAERTRAADRPPEHRRLVGSYRGNRAETEPEDDEAARHDSRSKMKIYPVKKENIKAAE